MKYNDRASRKFQQRSSDKEDDRCDFFNNKTTRKEKRERQRQFEYEIRTQMNHPLCNVMTNKQKVDLYEEYKWGTNGRWTSYSINHPDFSGNFVKFIDYLEENSDERISDLRIKLRNQTIHRLVG